ncbi:uncharacterized protein LOC142354880 [Convolutriloba macropyga]|uniref:uncharacterized protein LOC142354880 n=1 Tax=Convolutriloba macropyga TaxID=536237 RepID=UPI003F52625C
MGMTRLCVRFEEGLVVSVPVKFYPGAFEVVEDLDISQSPKAPKNNSDESTESEAENSAEQQNIEWSQFVEKVCNELKEEKELAVAMPVEKKIERERTELDQTEVGAPDLINDETLLEEQEDPTVIIEKERDDTEVPLEATGELEGGEGAETGRDLQQPDEQQIQSTDPEQPQETKEAEPSEEPQPQLEQIAE